MEEAQEPKEKIRLSVKEGLVTVAGALLALGSFRAEDPWVVIPTLVLSCGAFVYLCLQHEGAWKWRISSAIAIILVFGSLAWRVAKPHAHAEVTARTSKPSPELKLIPHLSAQLVMGAYKNRSLQPRLIIENIGPVAIGSIQVAMDTGDAVGIDNVPTVEELQPQAKTEIPFPLMFKQPSATTLAAVLIYRILDQPTGTIYHSRFRFGVSSYTSPTDSIFPGSTEEGEGDLGYGKESQSLLKRLGRSKGTVYIELPEFNRDGRPNRGVYQANNKMLVMDVAQHKASLLCRYPSGNKIAVAPLKPAENNIYIIAISWDDSKQNAVLYVDGKPYAQRDVLKEPLRPIHPK